MPKKCILGCSYNRGMIMHRFPSVKRYPEQFRLWVNIITEKLGKKEEDFFAKSLLCDIHFNQNHKVRWKRLSRLAVPCLHLSGYYGATEHLQTMEPTATYVQTEAGDMPFSTSEMPETEIKIKNLSIKHIQNEHNYCSLHKNRKKKSKSVMYDLSNLSKQLKITQSQLRTLKLKMCKMQKNCKSYKDKLESIEKLNKDEAFKSVCLNMTPAAKFFTKMQWAQTKKKPKGRRFSIEEKVLALTMYKKSPKGYKLLSNLFTLPSAKCLKRLLSQVKLESGLNKAVFIKIKETVNNLAPEDRICSLIFDEMSITPQLQYDSANDKLRGFAHENKTFADHALVFMVKGAKKNYKQPIAYYFTNCLNKYQLKNIIKKVVRYVSGTGLKIVCTICDQSTVNVSTINELKQDTKTMFIKSGKEWRGDIIVLGKATIVPLFDVLHLVKGLRNNLLTKNMKYFDFGENVEKLVKWEYFQKVYEADKCYGDLRILHKITDEHIYIEKIKKMKVKLATQIFSHSFAVAAEHMTGRGDAPEECRQIINFVKLVDNLFDSLNSNSSNSYGKIYKGCVKKHSPHHELWINAVKILKTVKFLKIMNESGEVRFIESTAVPTIKNLILTIEGFQYLWKLLSGTYSVDAMFTRNFNQDPLENFFGNIRSLGVRNTAPNTVAFEGAYKSLLLNNFNSTHSLGANCESDNNSCLNTLDFFLKDNLVVTEEEAIQYAEENYNNDDIVLPFIDLSNESQDAGQGNYVCGWVLTKCFKNVCKACKYCKKELSSNTPRVSNDLIRAKEYNTGCKWLLYPSEAAEKSFIQIQKIVVNVLKRDVPESGLKKKIKIFTSIFVEYPSTCEEHKHKFNDYFENTCINILVYSWCRSVNRILAGKITYTETEDEIKTAAQVYQTQVKNVFRFQNLPKFNYICYPYREHIQYVKCAKALNLASLPSRSCS